MNSWKPETGNIYFSLPLESSRAARRRAFANLYKGTKLYFATTASLTTFVSHLYFLSISLY